jgi:hypothetical protein
MLGLAGLRATQPQVGRAARVDKPITVDDPGFHLARLVRFAGLGQDERLPLVAQRLARHATLSAYRDCQALDIEGPARLVLAVIGVEVV